MSTIWPQERSVFYRAVMTHFAQPTAQAGGSPAERLKREGYGVVNLEQILTDAPLRFTYATTGENRIKAKQVHVYRVRLSAAVAAVDTIRLEVTLAYTAQPCRIGRGHRDYCSTWLSWESSRKGEPSDTFLQRMLKEVEDAERSPSHECLRWAVGTRKQLDRHTGDLKRFSRNAGTLQRDWTQVRRAELGQEFCIAVVGHRGWDNGLDADATYVLLLSTVFSGEKVHVVGRDRLTLLVIPVDFNRH